MSDWSISIYGDPCRVCGFDWSISAGEAVALVARLPDDFHAALGNARGDEQRPDLTWSVGSYVCHVADNLRIWAERLVGSAGGSAGPVVSYDENELARVRGYVSIPLAAAQWSLRRSVDDWLQAVADSAPAGEIMRHPVRGPLTLGEIVKANTHDGTHHLHDITTSLAG